MNLRIYVFLHITHVHVYIRVDVWIHLCLHVYMYVGGGLVQLPRGVLLRRRSVLRRLGGRGPPAARVAGPLLVQPCHVGPRGLGQLVHSHGTPACERACLPLNPACAFVLLCQCVRVDAACIQRTILGA